MSGRPTSRQLLGWEDTQHLEEVEEKTTGTWRHGSTHRIVVRDKTNGKFWACDYRRDKDNEYNSARDEGEEVVEVIPMTKLVTVYEAPR